jgi:fumarate reductase subunit D
MLNATVRSSTACYLLFINFDEALALVERPPNINLFGEALPSQPEGPLTRVDLSALTHRVTAMVKNLVAGCVIVALMIMGLLVYAQKHEGCSQGA